MGKPHLSLNNFLSRNSVTTKNYLLLTKYFPYIQLEIIM